MKYYILQIAEDQEIFVKKAVEGSFPWIKVIIPIKAETVLVDGKKVLTFNRSLEEYVVLNLNKALSTEIKEIERIAGVVGFLKDDGKPSEVPTEDLEQFLNGLDKEDCEEVKEGMVNIINGTHAGRRGRITGFKPPLIRIGITNSLGKKKVISAIMPIWHIVKLIEEK